MSIYIAIFFSICLYILVGIVLSSLMLSIFDMYDKEGSHEMELLATALWPFLVLYTICVLSMFIVYSLTALYKTLKTRFRGKHLLPILFLGLFTLAACTKQDMPVTPNDPIVVVRGPTSAPVGSSVTFEVVAPHDWDEYYKWEVPWGWEVEHPRIYIEYGTTVTHIFNDVGLFHVRVFCYSHTNQPALIGMHNISIYDE